MHYGVLVLGGGTAGLVTASGCARLGRRVALIERGKLGGDCLWTGCVPTKALVASARLAHQMRNAAAFGLEAHEPVITPRAIMDAMREARAITARHDDPEKFRALGIDVITGNATFSDQRTVDVDGQRISAKDIVIATGSRTAVPPIDGLQESGFLDHASFLDRDELPRSILILGGGTIGIEFAQIFRRFGCDVTVVEMLETIVPREDADVIAGVRALLEGEGVVVRTGCRVVAVRVEGDRKIMTVESGGKPPHSKVSAAPRLEDIAADAIFVASGRRGNIDDLNLDAIGVKTSRSYVEVDKHLQTSVLRIWACGDVHGGLQFTHVAAYEAVKLVRNMLFPGKSAVRYDNVPWALFTDPEVGHLGMTEAEARAAHGEVRVFRVEMADVDRAVVDRATGGFLKLIADGKGRLLGAHAFCAGASTLIQTLAVARAKGVRVGELAQIVSAYPSMGDAIGKAAGLWYAGLSSSRIGAIARKLARLSQ